MTSNSLDTFTVHELEPSPIQNHIFNTSDLSESRASASGSLTRSEIQATVRENTLKALNSLLETELVDTKENLANAKADLAATKAALEIVLQEKNQEIDRLKNQLRMQGVVDHVLARPARVPNAQGSVRGHIPAKSDVTIGSGESQVTISMRRKADGAVEVPATPQSKLRPNASAFIPSPAYTSAATPARLTDQSLNDNFQAPIHLSPSLRALDDDAFEKLMLGIGSEPVVTPEEQRAPSPLAQEDKHVRRLDRSSDTIEEPAESQDKPPEVTYKLDSLENFQPELPTSFLSNAEKYRDAGHSAGASVTEFVPSTSEIAKTFSKILKDNPTSNSDGKRIHLSAPNNFAIKWNYQYKTDIFGDLTRYNAARNDVVQRSVYHNMFWRNGLRYTPADPSEENAFRTIMIEDIPVGTTPKQIHDVVMGGKLESFQLCDTSSITGFLTARIVYIYQQAAYDMINYVRQLKSAGSDGLFVNNSKLHVVHATAEATTLPPTDLCERIYEYGFTRVLRLTNMTHEQVSLVELNITDAIQMKRLGNGKGHKLAMDVVLKSIRDADIWKLRLQTDGDFKGAELEIGDDPCDVRLDEVEIAGSGS